jgi:hypothetical protein
MWDEYWKLVGSFCTLDDTALAHTGNTTAICITRDSKVRKSGRNNTQAENNGESGE